MDWRRFLFGRPLRTEAEAEERIGPLAGIPVLGLDALASASYGPEAALTILVVAGPAAPPALVPVIVAIIALLLLVTASYWQTIAAYPGGGGSFTVAHENLGPTAGLIAAAALATDYILNVAVAISAGVGAVVSAMPALLPHTLALCLGVLALLTLINLRGIRTAGLVFMTPTYAFVALLGIVLGAGLFRVLSGAPLPAPPHAVSATTHAAAPVGLWLLLRAFASGCTAMTGVEAVSNAVPLFREPQVTDARRTLAAIVVILVLLLGGLAILVRAFGITATAPGEPGFESVVSQVVAAVMGRGGFYFAAMTAVLAVLALSANTSFSDFPRVCRVLAADHYLPPELARRGGRLVYDNGILLLAAFAAILLVAFGGITDHLIPLFAIGALLAFTMSQLGMVWHWRRHPEPGSRLKLGINAAGAAATSIALGIVVVSKFTHGAWLTALVIPALVIALQAVKRYNDRLAAVTRDPRPLDLADPPAPIVVVPLRRLDQVSHKALRLASALSREVYVVQVTAEELDTEDLQARWRDRLGRPASEGRPLPALVLVRSPYREFFNRFLEWLRQLLAATGERPVIVLIPELVQRRWFHFLLNHRATRLKARLLFEGGPRVSVMSTPWYAEPGPDDTGG
jgi:amino acid transporter